MCNIVDKATAENALGCFDKRNDGQVQHFPVIVAQCVCGDMLWARVEGGILWVEAEKMENRNVDKSAAEELERDVRRARPQTDGGFEPAPEAS